MHLYTYGALCIRRKAQETFRLFFCVQFFINKGQSTHNLRCIQYATLRLCFQISFFFVAYICKISASSPALFGSLRFFPCYGKLHVYLVFYFAFFFCSLCIYDAKHNALLCILCIFFAPTMHANHLYSAFALCKKHQVHKMQKQKCTCNRCFQFQCLINKIQKSSLKK